MTADRNRRVAPAEVGRLVEVEHLTLAARERAAGRRRCASRPGRLDRCEVVWWRRGENGVKLAQQAGQPRRGRSLMLRAVRRPLSICGRRGSRRRSR